MMQNLHALVTLLPDGTQQLVEAFRHRFKPRRVGTLMSNISAMDTTECPRERFYPQDIDEETRSLLGEWMQQQKHYSKFDTPTQASYLKKCEHQGAELKPNRVAFGDSLVIIGDHATWRAAQIEILLDVRLYPSGVETHHTVARVRYFAELSVKDASQDPYRHFRNAGRIVYENGLGTNEGMVSIDQILCHFAMTPNVCPNAIPKRHIHVLPLLWVRRNSFKVIFVLQLTKIFQE